MWFVVLVRSALSDLRCRDTFEMIPVGPGRVVKVGCKMQYGCELMFPVLGICRLAVCRLSVVEVVEMAAIVDVAEVAVSLTS